MLDGEDMSEQVKLWIDEVVEETVLQFTQDEYSEEWDLEALTNAMARSLRLRDHRRTSCARTSPRSRASASSRSSRPTRATDVRGEGRGVRARPDEQPLMRELERFVILQVVDVRWREHLENMDYLREGVHLRSMAQKDPLVEYTGEGERMFTDLGRAIRGEVVLHLFHAELAPEEAQQLDADADDERRTSSTSTRSRRAPRHRRRARRAAARGRAGVRRSRRYRPRRTRSSAATTRAGAAAARSSSAATARKGSGSGEPVPTRLFAKRCQAPLRGARQR